MDIMQVKDKQGNWVTVPAFQGQRGKTPSFSIGRVDLGTTPSSAAATITGTDDAPVLNLVLPKGIDGDNGKDGKDGKDGLTTSVNGIQQIEGNVTITASDIEASDGDSVQDHLTSLDDIFSNLVDYVYPVGSIYMSVNSTSPATLFGGTWERITGRFLLAATDNGVNGGNSSASVKPGYTGGEATSTLEVANLPGHTHTVYGFKGSTTNTTRNKLVMQNDGNLVVYQSNGSAKWNAGSGQTSTSVAYKDWTAGEDGTTSSTGSNTSFNNMPPYLAVYVWKRLS